MIVTVLVVEYGYFDNNPAQIQPRSAENYIWPIKDLFNLTSTPQAGLAGSVQAVYSASVVGGGSTVNGMFLNRGSARDYDNWGRLNNDDTWSWKGLLPYFVKVGLGFE
jgi:choline dehydrogenase-like flavoprotein